MAKRRTKQEIIEAKYGKLVQKAYKQYANRTMGEFIPVLEKLRSEMEKEMVEVGILKEDKENEE